MILDPTTTTTVCIRGITLSSDSRAIAARGARLVAEQIADQVVLIAENWCRPVQPGAAPAALAADVRLFMSRDEARALRDRLLSMDLGDGDAAGLLRLGRLTHACERLK